MLATTAGRDLSLGNWIGSALKTKSRVFAPLSSALVLLLGAASIAHSQPQSLAMLNTLETGEWQVKARDGSLTRRLCSRDGRAFVQLRHGGRQCNRYVVEDSPSAVTVQYSCPGNGYGRTHIRKETSRLVQIQSQGIADGLPFEFQAEARWIGPCRE